MTNFQLPSESFQYTYAAHEEAQKAGIQANYGYRNKLMYYERESILRRWKELMINAPIALHNTLFILFAIGDLIISWDMLRDVVSISGINPTLEFVAILTFCLLINAWAIVTAHFIGRGWSAEIHDWERWNFIFIKNKNQSPMNVVAVEMAKEKSRARFWAIISGAILIGLVAAIIYYRTNAISVLSNQQTDFDETANNEPAGLSLILMYLPLAIIIGELFTGDYFWYSIRKIQTAWNRNRFRRKFLHFKEVCGVHDRLAVQYAEKAGSRVELIGDLNNSHLRFKFRSQQHDDYIDPLDNFKKFGFCIKSRGTGKPMSNVAIFGVLPNGAKTGDYITDEEGRATILIEGDFDKLVSVGIMSREFLGPFYSSGEHYIDVPEPLLEMQPLNGHN